jgi:hypothetical protein
MRGTHITARFSEHAKANLTSLLFFGAFLLTSCAAATSPSLYRVTELVPGISTRDDAVAKLGPPSSTSNVGTVPFYSGVAITLRFTWRFRSAWMGA